MALEVTIGSDESVECRHRRRSSGLAEIFATGLTGQVNALDANELGAVVLAVKLCPFPLTSDNAENTYRRALAMVKGPTGNAVRAMRLGELRKALLLRASEGCNAPHDHYLKVAHQVKTGKPVDLYGAA